MELNKIISNVLYKYKDAQANLGSETFRENLAKEIEENIINPDRHTKVLVEEKPARFKAIQDLADLRANEGQEDTLSGLSDSGHTQGYSTIEGMIRQSTENPIKEAQVITMKEFTDLIDPLIDSDSSK